MRLRPYLYYFCERRKVDITKIRRYCANVDCPHLMVRPKKNHHRERSDGNGEEENDFPRMPRLWQGQIQRQVPTGDLPALNVLQEGSR